MLERLQLSPESHRTLMAACADRGILFLSTPFDEGSVDLLDALGVPAFKIGSGEITNVSLLKEVARRKKPVILSTGMSTLQEVKEALRLIRNEGNDRVVLLHCVSAYPAEPSEVNLRAMQTMTEAFHCPVGYSDHTQGIEVALAAVACGACVIEKHFTLDRTLPGPDHIASLEPNELKALVRGIRTVESALGHGRKEPTPGEAETAAVARKSLVAARTIQAGIRLTEEFIAVKRPGIGLPPGMMNQVIGRLARRDILEGTPLTLEMLE